MAEQAQAQVQAQHIRDLKDVLKEVEEAVARQRASENISEQRIIDLRWKFDQISAKMNQAIYNDQTDQIYSSCLATVAVLIEILSRK